MRKLTLWILALCLITALAGCGESGQSTPEDGSETAPAVTTPTVAPTEAATEPSTPSETKPTGETQVDFSDFE